MSPLCLYPSVSPEGPTVLVSLEKGEFLVTSTPLMGGLRRVAQLLKAEPAPGCLCSDHV